jgi:hypothetical protein
MVKKSVVITFGRFQPPTIGHEKLINAVIAHANKIGAEHRIYASQSFDGNRPRAAVKNPLQYNDKIKFMRKMFPGANIVKGDDDTNTFMRVLYQLQKEKYTTVHVVVGDDRVPEIKKTVKQYLGSDDPETGLNFEDFKVVSAGKRDPEAEGVEGMSASKLRAAAADNDFKLFKKGMPSAFSDARELFDAIRKGLEKPMKPEKKTKKAKVNEELLNEVTPPDDKSERFVKKAKASFKDRYGDDWASYLYGVAWKQYNKRHGKPTKTRLGEPIEVEEETLLDEAITIPKNAQVVDRNKEEKTVTVKWNDEDGWHEEEIPEDEVPGFYDRAADPLKQRKTDRFGNIMKTPAKGAEKKTEKAMAANKKNAQEIVDIIKKKPMKTPITVYGKKYGKNDEYELVIMRRLYMGDEVYVVKSSGRFVELNVGASGLQIVDAKTKKILLDKGNDATW